VKQNQSKKTKYIPPSIYTNLECPRCNSKLRQLIVGLALPQIYYCTNCGYRGPIGLQPEKEVKKKKTKQTRN
jgi:predicted RNA-binding Zn-ribbon protein involved in translation (DUF1610 family)